MIRQWTDKARDEQFATTEGQKRQLVVRFWYPAKVSDTDTFASYMPAADQTLTGVA